MIQDIAPHVFNNHYITQTQISPSDYILFFSEGKLMLKKEGEELDIPCRSDFNEIAESEALVYLFSLNNKNCYLLFSCTNYDPKAFVFEEISFFRTFNKREVAWVSIVANHVRDWYLQNKYCGKCGNPTRLKDDERAIACKSCNNIIYPKISPAIIVGITCGDKILLASGRNFRSNFYSLVAGYADIGESLEDAVAREVKEEVGIEVKNIRYYKSQPWPFSGSMMIGYWAEADDTQPIKIDPKEIVDAAWYKRGELPNHPNTISIAGEMIELFEKGMF